MRGSLKPALHLLYTCFTRDLEALEKVQQLHPLESDDQFQPILRVGYRPRREKGLGESMVQRARLRLRFTLEYLTSVWPVFDQCLTSIWPGRGGRRCCGRTWRSERSS